MTKLPNFVDFYKTAYPNTTGEIRMAGTLSATLLETRQGPGDWSAPPSSDLCVTVNVGNIMRWSCVDLGAGRLKDGMQRGEFGLTPPGTATQIVMDDYADMIILCVPYARLLSIQGEAGLPKDGDFGRLHAQINVDPEMPRLFAQLWGAMHGAHAGSVLLSDALVLQVMSRLLDLAGRKNRPATGGLAPWQVRKAREIILDRLAETVTLVELAEAVGLSPWHFCRAFAQTVGVTPHRAQMLARLDQAREMLGADGNSITDIALNCGYQSSQAFSRVFRKETGATPAAYRRAVRG